jgi:hypothetical protein
MMMIIMMDGDEGDYADALLFLYVVCDDTEVIHGLGGCPMVWIGHSLLSCLSWIIAIDPIAGRRPGRRSR